MACHQSLRVLLGPAPGQQDQRGLFDFAGQHLALHGNQRHFGAGGAEIDGQRGILRRLIPFPLLFEDL